jgi:hypothetical protein
MGSTTVCSDGSVFTQMGSFSTDGSTRMGSSATGLGAGCGEGWSTDGMPGGAGYSVYLRDVQIIEKASSFLKQLIDQRFS